MTRLVPRLSYGQMPPELAESLRPRVERLGYLGEFFQCAAHQPKALLSFMTYTEELKAALPENLFEVVALSVSSLMNNAYERIQQERRCLQVGFNRPWIREVSSLAPSTGSTMTDQERLVQQLVIAVVSRRGHDSKSELEAVVSALGHANAVAILMLIGRYVAHALMVNCLGLAPPALSPLEER